ncbi:MAG TPA: O-antigen ligase family protein [Mycobacteriales bacterium]|nr:O-antigen ligase family protein [Mycobacteriales bacterium]
MIAAAAWWLLIATRWWGGRQAGAVTGGAIVTGIAVLVVRPDRVLPRSIVWLAAWLSVAALLVAVLSPTGWAGATNAADYVCAAWTVVAVAAAAAAHRAVVTPLLAVVVLGTMVEVAEAWLPWWGGEDPTRPMIGTFYWWDPFAAYLLAGSVLGYAAWLRGRGAPAALGLAGFVLGSVGLVYSTSRAADACFVAALILVTITQLLGGWVAVRRSAMALVVGGLAAWAVGGPPFFPHRAQPFAATAARGSGQSLSRNGHYRTEFWREALGVYSRHPLFGGGYHSLATESVGHVPAGWSFSPLAHSGYLQALSDGGLILAVPFLLCCAGIVLIVLISLVGAMRRRDFSVTGFVVPLALGGLLAHSAIDFDWSYPADLLLVAILSGIVVGRWAAERQGRVAGRRLTACAVLVGVVTLGIAAGAAWSGDLRLSLPVGHSAADGSAR